MSKRHSDALYIQNGAVNPRAVARSLVSAIDEVCDEQNGSMRIKDAAVRLILHQLVFIVEGTDLYNDCAFESVYYDDVKTCEAEAVR